MNHHEQRNPQRTTCYPTTLLRTRQIHQPLFCAYFRIASPWHNGRLCQQHPPTRSPHCCYSAVIRLPDTSPQPPNHSLALGTSEKSTTLLNPCQIRKSLFDNSLLPVLSHDLPPLSQRPTNLTPKNTSPKHSLVSGTSENSTTLLSPCQIPLASFYAHFLCHYARLSRLNRSNFHGPLFNAH